MNAKQVMIHALNEVEQDDEVVVIINRNMNDGTTNQCVIHFEIEYIQFKNIDGLRGQVIKI
ncbi:hypothetical protein WMA08_02285 [Staphylococcus simulans]|uniref:hypothetical protein n=1 Tax=Staphylococcus simulans TaxID=1286 RepID=UPI0030C13D98